jgi:DNA-binding transcriptional MerR regulator
MAAIKFEEFLDSTSLDKLVELYEIITDERLSVRDTGINYRVINHWDEKGLIRFARNSKEGNRRFSFVDFIWIKVVNELREFGVSLPDIQKISKDVYEPLPIGAFFENIEKNLSILNGYEGNEELIQFIKSGAYKDANKLPFEFNFLQILIAEAIATRKPISILLFKNCDWFAFFKERAHLYPEELIYKMEYASHLSVSITDIVFRFITEDELEPYFKEIHIFSSGERQLLAYIKDGHYKKVIVKLKAKDAEPLEIKKGDSAKEQLLKIIRLQHYKEFIVIDNKNNEIRIVKGKL